MMLNPIDATQRECVAAATDTCLRHAADLFGFSYQPLIVSFDLTGRAVGQYRVDRRGRMIRYNPYLFARYFTEGLDNTVPHEVAHHVVDRLYGLRNVLPHGKEWKQIMCALGAEPRASARYELAGVPMRRQRRFLYRCDCSEHALSSCRHNRIKRHNAVYVCRSCGTPVIYAER